LPDSVGQEPLSEWAVLSRPSDPLQNDDSTTFMQISARDIHTCKHDDFEPHETALISALSQGTADTVTQAMQDESDHDRSAPSSSGPVTSSHSPVMQSPSESAARQDVIIFHLQDPPIRAFLDWGDYESMMTELAHHFAVHRQGVVDAYEIAIPLSGMPPDVYPIIAQLLPDIALGQDAKLVLFDLELHGHKVEPHFRLGPITRRFVLPVPLRADRNGILTLANVDKYCHAEGGRCLVFFNDVRWPDYDLDFRPFSHGDAIRIAIPPSDRIECPTDQVVRWTQRDFTELDIMRLMNENAPSEGYSPSLLGDEEVRSLATPAWFALSDNEEEDFSAMQRQPANPAADTVHVETANDSRSNEIPQDWFIDLQRVVSQHVNSCPEDGEDEFLFSIYTWFLDHEESRLCNNPKIVVLGGLPSEWEEDVLHPWRYQIDADERPLLSLVAPFSPRADVEEHIAHIIITQRPSALVSILVSIEFYSMRDRSVVVRFAVALPKVCTFADIRQAVPFLTDINWQRLVWLHPLLQSTEQSFRLHDGMCILLQMPPENELESQSLSVDQAPEDTSLVQVSARSTSDSNPHSKEPLPTAPVCSIMDELLNAVNAANNAIDNQLPPIDQFSIEAQPESFRDLWERITDNQVGFEPDASRTHRLESWFLDHTDERNRCLLSRIILIGEDFLAWRHAVFATWSDRLAPGADFTLSIVHPATEDAAIGVLAQVIITQNHAVDLRSTVVSVYDSDPDMDRQPFTFAIVLPGQFELQELLQLINLQQDCPPVVLHKHCSLWFGEIPFIPGRRVYAHSGHAFRLVISRGLRVAPTELLTMHREVLRQTVQNALVCDIFARPPGPTFTRHAADNSESAPHEQVAQDARPPWITELHHRFRRSFTCEGPDYEPFVNVTTWYVNGGTEHNCNVPRAVRITEDFSIWRTDIVFAWRDRLTRATVADFVTVQGLPAFPGTQDLQPHVIMHQSLTLDQHPVLVAVRCLRHQAFPDHRFAHVFLTRTRTNAIGLASIPLAFQHLPFVVQLNGITYLPGEEIFVQAGNHLLVLAAQPGIDPFTEQIVDGFSLLQSAVSWSQRSTDPSFAPPPFTCKPAPFDEDTDLPMTFAGPRRNRPRRPVLDGNLDWTHDLAAAIRADGELDVWTEATTISVITWFIDHHAHPICRQPRFVTLNGEVITWIDDLRIAWADELDPNTEFSIQIVRPRPPRPRHQRQNLHLILEQNRPAQRVAIILTALFENAISEGLIQGAYSTPNRLDLGTVIDIMNIRDACAHQFCRVAFDHQILFAGTFFEAAPGSSVRIHIEPDDDDSDNAHDRHDEVTLMQCSSGLQWTPRRRSNLVQAADSSMLNPMAPEFVPGTCHLYTQNEFVQDLFEHWQDVAISFEGEAHSARVITWFLDHSYLYPKCIDPRTIVLYDDFGQWENQIRAAWADRLQGDCSVEIYLVSPTPPNLEPGVAAHIVVIAAPRDDWISVLVTMFGPEQTSRQTRVAITTHEHLSFDRVIQAIGANSIGIGALCNLWYEQHQFIASQLYPGRSGYSLVLHTPNTFTLSDSQELDSLPQLPSEPEVWYVQSDDMHLLQRSATQQAMPSFVSRSLNKVSETRLATWFLDSDCQPVCFHSRLVVIPNGSDSDAVFRAFRDTWQDKITTSDQLSFAWFSPSICSGEEVVGFCAPIKSDLVPILVEARLSREGQTVSDWRAALVQSGSPASTAWSIFGVVPEKVTPRQAQCGEFLINNQPCGNETLIEGSNAVIVTFSWSPDLLARIPIQVNFEHVLRAHDILDTHFLLPIYDLPPSFPWLPTSWEWAQTCWWTPGWAGHEVRIYYDGSSHCHEQSKVAGSAVAAFIKSEGVWCFAGAISTALAPGTSSYKAELSAAVLAHKFLHDLLKLLSISQDFAPTVELCYDSQTVGHQAEGSWQVWSQPRMGQFLRSLHRWIERKFQVTLHHKHVAAHQGEPGNELVDCLAYQAAGGYPLHDLRTWIDEVTKPDFVEAVEWIWYLFKPDVRWNGNQIVFPAGPLTQPDASVLPTITPQVETSRERHAELNIKMATCNVLSLKPLPQPDTENSAFAPASSTGPARQESLIRQFHEAGIHVFAWQETRPRKLYNRHDERYWLFRSPATAHGHYGILVGLQRVLPILGRLIRKKFISMNAKSLSLPLHLDFSFCQ